MEDRTSVPVFVCRFIYEGLWSKAGSIANISVVHKVIHISPTEC